jgi:hypothetical protein
MSTMRIPIAAAAQPRRIEIGTSGRATDVEAKTEA